MNNLTGTAALRPQVQSLSLFGLTNLEDPGQLATNSLQTLLAISHSIEDVVTHNHYRAPFFAGFQRASSFLPQARRFSRLASVVGKVYIFAYPDVAVPTIPNIEFVFLTEDAPLAQEWFLVFQTPDFQAALLTHELDRPGVTHFGRGRDYEGLVTFDPAIVQAAQRALHQAVGLPTPPEVESAPLALPTSPYAEFHQNLIRYLEQRNRQLRGLYRTLDNRSKEIERLQAITRRMVSNAAWDSAEQLAQTGALPPLLESQRKTILFTDVKDFVRLTEMTAPESLVDSLNRYLDAISTVVYQNNGDVDKFLGDGMLAFFDEPWAALKAAMEIQNRVRSFNAQQTAARQVSLPTRVSLSTGPCLIGPLGSQDRKEVTLIGRPVNLASRLNAYAPVGGIVVDDETFIRVKAPVFAARYNVKVKNMEGNLPVYEFDENQMNSLRQHLARLQSPGPVATHGGF